MVEIENERRRVCGHSVSDRLKMDEKMERTSAMVVWCGCEMAIMMTKPCIIT